MISGWFKLGSEFDLLQLVLIYLAHGQAYFAGIEYYLGMELETSVTWSIFTSRANLIILEFDRWLFNILIKKLSYVLH